MPAEEGLMGDPGGKHSVAGVDEQIVAEHRRIRELARQLDHAPELRELLTRLAELRGMLVAHFLREEAAEGLYNMIRSMAPRLLGRMAQLEKEHQTFLDDIDKLGTRARECLAGPVAEVLREAQALTRRLRKHEAAEDEVLLDTLYTDLGQGD
jgi:hemerythrin HHE cation binding domain-containing protein